jgi:hypothetical protein
VCACVSQLVIYRKEKRSLYYDWSKLAGLGEELSCALLNGKHPSTGNKENLPGNEERGEKSECLRERERGRGRERELVCV